MKDEIRLAKIYDNFPESEIKIIFDEEITQEQFEKLKLAKREIDELKSIQRLYDFVCNNGSDLLNFINTSFSELMEKTESWNSIKQDDGSKIFLNVNRLLLNYLSSIRTFLDHTRTYVSRKYGKQSVQLVEYDKSLSGIYDISFAYRFFYKLRNYSQHVGLPIGNVQYKTEFNKEENQIKVYLQISFSRDQLLSNYDSWGAIKAELELLEENFTLVPLLMEVTHYVNEIKKMTISFQEELLIEATNFILEVIQNVERDEGEIFIAYNLKTDLNNKLERYSRMNIPLDAIEYLNKELGRD